VTSLLHRSRSFFDAKISLMAFSDGSSTGKHLRPAVVPLPEDSLMHLHVLLDERCCSFLPLRGEKRRQVVGCWLIVCLRHLACPPSWLVTLRGDIRFKNIGLSRTGIHEKPSNRAAISRFSSQMTRNL
jgi:hypothetical protein